MRRRLASVVVAAGSLAAAVFPGSAASAAPGDLDGTFGTAGRVVGLAGSPEAVLSVGTSTLTAAVVSGEPDVIRVRAFTASGGTDAAWFGDGTLDVPVVGGGFATQVRLGVDGSGRLVVAAGILNDDDGQRIWRFEADGDPDLTFSGDGLVVLPNLGGYPGLTGLGFQPDGDVIVGINDTFIFGGFAQRPDLVRLTSAGVPAQTVAVLADHSERGSQAEVVVDAQGRPHVLLPDDGKLTVRRYTEALALDNGFSGDGIAAVGRPGATTDNENWGGDLAVAADGSVTVAGTVGRYEDGMGQEPVSVEEATLVARLLASGAPDPAFSSDGIAALARTTGDLRVIGVERTALGGAAIVADRYVPSETPVPSETVVWQVDAAGAPENGFSGDGRVQRVAFPSTTTISTSGSRLVLAEQDGSDGWQLAALSLVAAAPATVPATPVAPVSISATSTSVTARITLPASGGSPITSVALRVFEGDAGTPSATFEQAVVGAGPVSVTATGLDPATRHRFRAVATNAVGSSSPSAASAWALPPFTTVEQFVRQQFTDFTSKAPTAAELSSLRGRVEAGTTTPAAAVVEVSGRAEWTTLDPLTRIYYAYFGRAPDSSGLRYWLGKRRSGTTVTDVSNQFVKSNEFKTKYGTLTNRAFVQLVYENVLGRAADTAGLNSWTSKLDRKVIGRGQVMVQFSESNEHKNRRAGEVNTVSVVFGLLGRAPTASEFTTWTVPSKTSKVPLIDAILTGAAYDARVPTS